MVTSDNQKSGPVVPGTNKYTMEGWGDDSVNTTNEWTHDLKYDTCFVFPCVSFLINRANPVLNLHIDAAMILDMDEDSSDVDKVR